MTVKDFTNILRWKYCEELEIWWDSNKLTIYKGVSSHIPSYLLNREVINIGLLDGEDNIKIFID